MDESIIHVHQISPTTLKIHYFRMVDGHCTDFDNFDPNSFSCNKTISQVRNEESLPVANQWNRFPDQPCAMTKLF